MKTRTTLTAILTVIAAALSMGCALERPPSEPASKSSLTVRPIEAPERFLWSTSLDPLGSTAPSEVIDRTLFVTVSEGILNACDSAAVPSPHFAFDSAKLNASDHRELTQLAQCFTTGPLQRRNLHIIGRTDPRGELIYNEELGERRAEGVRDFLVTHGVPREQVLITSRGELYAQGRDATTWADDRRVEILLAGEAPARMRAIRLSAQRAE